MNNNPFHTCASGGQYPVFTIFLNKEDKSKMEF